MAQSPINPKVLFALTGVLARGGIQRFNHTLLDACHRLGIRSHVYSLMDSGGALARYYGRSDHSMRGFGGDRARFAAAVGAALLRSRYDRVLIGHINLLNLVTAIQAIEPRRAAPTMLAAHGTEIWDSIDARRDRALRRVDRILCVSSYTCERILAQSPRLSPACLSIFPNALADTWGQLPLGSSARALHARFLLTVTRLERGDRYKGVASVIEAFSMLPDRSLQYFIVGQGDDLPFLQCLAERHGVSERVHFLRDLSDAEMVGLYRTCDAFVLPSGREGFGIVFLEAMFFGAPVIAAREAGATDVVRDGQTGLSVPFGDVVALREAIERLVSDRVLRERLREGGRSLVTGDGPFTFSSFVQRCAQAFGVCEARAV